MKYLKLLWSDITGMKTTNEMRMEKSTQNDWIVRRGHSVLYIGTKEKCKIFMDRGK